MSISSRDTNGWTLDGATGVLRGATFAAHVDLSRPELGVHGLRVHGQSVVGQFLSLSPSGGHQWLAKLSDAYVRGHDLVASYRAVDDWPYAPQTYWSAVGDDRGGTAAAISLLVSIQTSLLDTQPRVDVATTLRAKSVLHVRPTTEDDCHFEALPNGVHELDPASAASCVLWRLADLPISYAEIVPASDFRRLTVGGIAGGACAARWQLFAEFLEKGVIRRARVHVAFLPRTNDVELAADLCRAIENRPLPLTT